MENYKEFKVRICNKRSKGKINHSYGVRDVLKTIQKNKWLDIGQPLTEHTFYTIIRRVNDYLALELSNGRSITFPHKMGKLELVKYAPTYKIKDGKFKTNQPILWGETLKLWYESPEDRKNKVLVRNNSNFVYFIRYKNFATNYAHRKYYQFKVNRTLQRLTIKKALRGEIDTPWQLQFKKYD